MNQPLSILLAALLCAAPIGAARQGAATAVAPERAAGRAVPCELARVVDGDTIHVRLDGKVEKLRLLSVDTEEKLGVGTGSATKPGTVFGEECALWAQRFFADLSTEGAPARLGLVFPGGVRQRDVYGRLLCQVILPDGTDYNLMLVREGKSPYFTKYGYSEICHAEFVAAQAEARAKQRGIWNPATNAPATAGTPSAKRPYDELLAWWDARAEAVAAFHARRKEAPGSVVDAESAEALEEAAKRGVEVLVFGEVARVIEEEDGGQTVYLRATQRERALRVRVPKDRVAALAPARLAEMGEEFRQNYAWYRGRVGREGQGFSSICKDPAAWERAGPEPEKAPVGKQD